MIGHSTSRSEPGPVTWGVVRDQKIHMACATTGELCFTWAAFNGPEHAHANEPCERCGLPLSKVPDP